MIHYTLNTGDSRESPREEVTAEAVYMLRHMMTNGTYNLPKPLEEWFCTTQRCEKDGKELGVVFSIGRCRQKPEPAVEIIVAESDEASEAVWPFLEKLYRRVAAVFVPEWDRKPIRSLSAPWCCVILLPTKAMVDASRWIGDLERCLAWAWIEHCESETES